MIEAFRSAITVDLCEEELKIAVECSELSVTCRQIINYGPLDKRRSRYDKAKHNSRKRIVFQRHPRGRVRFIRNEGPTSVGCTEAC